MTDQTTEPGINYKLTQPDFLETLAQLQGGVVADLASRMLADVAMAVAERGDKKAKGKLILTLDISATNNPQLLDIHHKLEYRHPTVRGSKREDTADEQTMFVNRKGALTPSPDTQGAFDFSNTPVQSN